MCHGCTNGARILDQKALEIATNRVQELVLNNGRDALVRLEHKQRALGKHCMELVKALSSKENSNEAKR